jgi:multidrug resistance efflux pump
MIKYGLPLLAIALFGYAVSYVVKTRQTWPEAAPLIEPPVTPFEHTLAGSGLIEAESENISIGTPLAGIVQEIFVKQGEEVKVGAPLFRLDDRPARAELTVREALLASMEADLARLESLPRPEQVPVAEATVREAEAMLADRKDAYDWFKTLGESDSASAREKANAQNMYNQAQAAAEKARAELLLLKQGAWEQDKTVARVAVARAAAQVEQARTDLERLTVKALTEGLVLQVSIRPGEYVGADARALIVLGDVRTFHVRVDIDEYDIPRFDSGAEALGMLKGQPQDKYRLHFVRIEPYVIPKRSLTGGNTERVDTRVLQIIYALDDRNPNLFVGQQLDVYIKAKHSSLDAAVATKP